MDVIQQVKTLDLPMGEYVVFGSGPLSVHGIRDSRDIDLFVTPKLYTQLRQQKDWQERHWDDGSHYLTKDNIEIDDSWHYNDYNPSVEEVFAKAEIIDGIPFAPLEEVLKWKRAFGRPKDIADLKLIEQYLQSKESTGIDPPAKLIWNYMHLHHKLKKCDIILALGSSDLRVGEYAAKLFVDGYGDYLVISGGYGKYSKDIFHKPEAELFADIAIKMGVPPSKIITETKVANIGQNITFTYDLLRQKGISPKSLLLVHKPYMERRTYATFKKQWPDKDARIVVASPPIAYEDYFTPELSKEHVINTMVGDLQRIKEYPAKGFQIEQEIPEEVWSTYEQLVAAGFDKALS